MREITTIQTVLNLEEVLESPELSAKLIEKYRDINTEGTHWDRYVIERYDELLELLGFYNVQINYTGFWCQGDGASFTADFNYIYFDKKALAEYIVNAPLDIDTTIVDAITSIVGHCQQLEDKEDGEEELEHDFKVSRIGRYVHSQSINANDETMQTLARYISDKIYQDLEQEYDSLNEDQTIIDTLNANEYEYDSETLEII